MTEPWHGTLTDYTRRRAYVWANGRWWRFPNLDWGWRMPVRRVSWRLAWWLLLRVAMRGHTPWQQAAKISGALGAFRPESVPGALAPRRKVSTNVTTSNAGSSNLYVETWES